MKVHNNNHGSRNLLLSNEDILERWIEYLQNSLVVSSKHNIDQRNFHSITRNNPQETNKRPWFERTEITHAWDSFTASVISEDMAISDQVKWVESQYDDTHIQDIQKKETNKNLPFYVSAKNHISRTNPWQHIRLRTGFMDITLPRPQSLIVCKFQIVIK